MVFPWVVLIIAFVEFSHRDSFLEIFSESYVCVTICVQESPFAFFVDEISVFCSLLPVIVNEG